MADENTMRRLWRYKSDLEQELDEEKLIEILGKLKRLSVTISALQETGIGRVVNGYRKREGIVGDLARKVVGLWKSVVEAEVKTSKNRSPSRSPDNVASDAEGDDPPNADTEDVENAEAEDAENHSGNESDANSWNSFKEEDRNNQSSSGRKRKHSVDSACSQQGDGRSSESRKKDRHTKSESLRVDSAGDYIPDQKKKHAHKHGTEHRNHSRHGHSTKDTRHVASSKQDSDKHSSSSKRESDSKDNVGKTKAGSSSSSHRSIHEKSDRQTERSKVDRKQRRHSLSPSEEDDDDDDDDSRASGSSLISIKNVKPEPSSDTHKHSSSSSSHNASSNSHRHSTNSHRPSGSSDSQMQSPSISASSHSATSDYRKHSSTSSSHRQSNSDRPSLSSSHKPSSSSDSQKLSSDSHKHSSTHRHSSSSTSHKPSSKNEETKSSQHHRSSASPPEQQKGSLKPESSEPQSSRHTSDSNQTSGSSTSHRQSASSRSHDHSADHHRSSDHKSRSHDRSGNSSARSKDSLKHHSSSKKSTVSESESSTKELQNYSQIKLKEKSGHSTNSSPKDEGFSDTRSSSKKHSEKENHEKKADSSSSKQNNSHQLSEPLDFKKSSSTDNGNEKLLNSSLSGNKSGENKNGSSKFTKIKPTSSNHKRSRHKDTYTQPDLDLFSDAIHIKAEPLSPVQRSAKQTDTKTAKSQSSSSSKTAGCLPDHAPSDAKVKVESSVIEQKNSLGGSNSLKEEKVDTDEDSDSHQEYKKSASGKDKKRKTMESPEHENMSFEDFMAFDEAAVVKKGRSSVKSSAKTSSSSSSSRDGHSRVNKTSGGKSTSASDLPSSSKTGFSVPAPPSNVTVTELDILSMLPETQANYKPLRFNNYYRDEDEREATPPPLVDPDIIGTKAVSRTHVYSGRKHGITEVKPLYDLCMQVLIDNIDAIDCVGGIPYTILKPVLERCTAQQLYQLEDYNPHFLEDTDELWEVLCQRDFRGSKPDELETWRELYMRRFEERELKYQKLKQSMSSSISKGQSGRKAQLAYVDTVAKPPREVLRKQKQFGTGSVFKSKNNPNMKGSSSGIKTYRPSSLVPAHNPMDDRPRMMKAMPPMLAKSIQMRKNMRR